MNENNECVGGVCSVEKNNCCGGGHKHLVKWLIKIIIVAFIACAAFHVGEMNGKLESFEHMNRGYYGYGQNMMYGTDSTWGEVQPLSGTGSGATSVTPVTPATPAK